MNEIIWFGDADGANVSAVGGKGANLSLLTRAGFEVPPGFTITAGAYSSFLAGSGLDGKIGTILARLDFADTTMLDQATGEIRQLICATELPQALAQAIGEAYGKLGADTFVAVRSSGVAEDMEGASFAGMHDTYLDIRGVDALLDAVRRCWASLWTARATSYRQVKGFKHLDCPIALVIQTMVESEVSGVVFTGNPMNSATNEMIINASWGLGEAIVGGITTPDDFVVDNRSFEILDRRLGAKEIRVVRDKKTGVGTVHETNDETQRAAYSLTDQQVKDLAVVASRVQKHYEDFPQDIEWGLREGKFYVLQSRPITGVEFSWDADVVASCIGNDVDSYGETWSRAWAQEIWTGACTPLMFSWRGTINSLGLTHAFEGIGHPEFGHDALRHFSFSKGAVYYNLRQDRLVTEQLVPPPFRPGMIDRLPAAWHEDVLKAPFDYAAYLKYMYRHHGLLPHENLAWPETLEEAIATLSDQYNGLSDEQLRALSDAGLKAYVEDTVTMEGEGYNVVIYGLLFLFRDTYGLLGWMIANWYDGENTGAMTDIVTGTRRPTATAKENLALWKLSQTIRNTPSILETFRKHQDAEFFAHLQDSEEGRAFLADYATFVAEYGHRGHDDRDVYYLRRAEDPAVDYRAFTTILSGPSGMHPEAREEQVNAKREAVVAEVAANIAAKPGGAVKETAFRLAVDYMHKCLAGRDDERNLFDRSTFAIKKGYIEINRRLMERGEFKTGRDFYFLTRQELYALLLDGNLNPRLCAAKIAARMRDFDRVYSKEVIPPYYLERGLPVDLDTPIVHGEGVYRGAATSRGKIKGTARVIKTLKDIGRVQQGDILVTNSTDPGWTPVFLVISGIVLETGGMLAHGALLAREYGLPAVQIPGAMGFIPDGATVSLDGDSGVVVIESLVTDAELEAA